MTSNSAIFTYNFLLIEYTFIFSIQIKVHLKSSQFQYNNHAQKSIIFSLKSDFDKN